MTHRPTFLAVAICTAATVCTSALAATAKQQFTITSASAVNQSDSTRVVAEGAIDGRGAVDVRSSQDTRVDHMTLHLPKGEVFLVAIEKTYAVHPDPAKCLATAVGRGTFRITGGTGRFTGAHGLGTYIRHGVLYGARNAAGACLGQKAPISKTTARVVMTGTVNIG